MKVVTFGEILMRLNPEGYLRFAQAAFRRLMARIADPSLPPCDLFLPAQLVVRESTERKSVKLKGKVV